MKITYGICTDGKQPERVEIIKQSIRAMYTDKNIPFEIIEEIQDDGYITKQKNRITKRAKYENIVYLHDYIAFDKNWVNNVLQYGPDYDILMTRIEDDNGLRFRDWTLWYQDMFALQIPEDKKSEVFTRNQNYLLPYDWTEFTRWQYISGAFWMAKKTIMQTEPLNETLGWGQGEDMEWSKRVRVKYRLGVCSDAVVRFIKPGKIRLFNEIDPKNREYLREILC